MTQTLWVMKLGFLKIAIHQPNFTVTYYMHTLQSVLSHDNDSVVRTIRNYNQIVWHLILLFYTYYFAWVLEILTLSIFYLF